MLKLFRHNISAVFKVKDAMIWALLYVFKNIKFNFCVWLWFFTFFLRYYLLYEIVTTTQNKITIWKASRGIIKTSTIDRLWCTNCSFILLKTIWIYFVHVSIYFFNLLERYISENILVFAIHIDFHAYNFLCQFLYHLFRSPYSHMIMKISYSFASLHSLQNHCLCIYNKLWSCFLPSDHHRVSFSIMQLSNKMFYYCLLPSQIFFPLFVFLFCSFRIFICRDRFNAVLL